MARNIAIRFGVEGQPEVKRALDEAGRAGQEAFNKVGAAAEQSGAAVDRQTARWHRLAQAAREAQAQARAQEGVNALLGVRPAASGAARASAGAFEEDARLAAEARRVEQLAVARKQAVESLIGRSTVRVDRGSDISAYGDELDRIRARFVPLFDAQRRYKAELAEIAQAARTGAITEGERAVAVRRTKDAFAEQVREIRNVSAETRKLRPDQLTNLGYQASDVVAQLGSGTSLGQIAMQQGPQIAQIIAESGGLKTTLSSVTQAIGRFITPLTVAGSAITVFAGTVAYATAGYVAAQRELQRTTLGVGRASGATVEDLNRSAELAAARGGALSVPQARDAVAAMNATGKIDPGVYADAASYLPELARLMGSEVPEAAQAMAAALAGGVDGFDKLNAEVGLGGALMRQRVKDLNDSNEAYKAQRLVLDALIPRLAELRNQKGFFERLSDRFDIGRNTTSELNAIGGTVAGLFGSGTPQGQLAAARQRLAALRQEQATGGFGESFDVKDLPSEIAQTEATIAKLEGSIKATAENAKTAKTDLASLTVQPLVDSLNPAQARLREIRATAEGMRNFLDRGGVDQDGKIRSTMGVLTTQADSLEASLKKGGTAAEGALRQADFQRSSVGLSAYERGLAAINHEYDELIRKAKEAPGAAGDAGKLQEAVASYEKARAARIAAYGEENKDRAKEQISLPDNAVRSTIIAESGGDNFAKNPRSTAFGAGQFLASTFVGLFRKYDSELAAEFDRLHGSTKEADVAIAKLRSDRPTAEKYIGLYLRDIKADLISAGYEGSARNAQLGYFLGPGGAKQMLGANPGANAASILPDAARSNPEVFKQGAATVQDILNYAQKRAYGGSAEALSSQSRTAALKADAEIYDQSAARAEYLRAITEQLTAARERGETIGTKYGTAEELLKAKASDLTADLAAQRDMFIELAKARQTVVQSGLLSRFERDIQGAQDALGRTSDAQSIYMQARAYATPGTSEFDSASARLGEIQALAEAKSILTDASTSFASDLRRSGDAAEALSNVLGSVADRLTAKAIDSVVSGGFDALIKGGGASSLGDMIKSIMPGSYDGGGYTGPGGRLDIAGVAHRGEVIFSQDDVARAGGVGAVEAIRRRGLPGYASGGPVGFRPPIMPSAPAPQVVFAPNIIPPPGYRAEMREVPDDRSGRRPEITFAEVTAAGINSRQGRAALAQTRRRPSF